MKAPPKRLTALCVGCGNPVRADLLDDDAACLALATELASKGWSSWGTDQSGEPRCPHCLRDGDGVLRRYVVSRSDPSEFYVLRRARRTDPWFCDCKAFHFHDRCEHVDRALPFAWRVDSKDPSGALLTSATYRDPDDVLDALAGFGCLSNEEVWATSETLEKARDRLYSMRLDEPTLDDLAADKQPFFADGTGTVVTRRLS